MYFEIDNNDELVIYDECEMFNLENGESTIVKYDSKRFKDFIRNLNLEAMNEKYEIPSVDGEWWALEAKFSSCENLTISG